MNINRILHITCISLLLSGCAAAVINTSTLAVKGLPRSELQSKADAGDAVAQYELGKSYCCMGPGFDTQTATEWYCKAAHQGNSDAMYELGRVYMGDVSRTPAPGQKLLLTLSSKTSPAHAYLWLSKAAELGHEDAELRLAKLNRDIAEEVIIQAKNLTTESHGVACEYNDVFKK